MKILNSKSVTKAAARYGYSLSTAGSTVRMEAAERGDKLPRWELNPEGNQRADGLKGFRTLADVVDFLDQQDWKN